jgi:hypothetical protein
MVLDRRLSHWSMTHDSVRKREVEARLFYVPLRSRRDANVPHGRRHHVPQRANTGQPSVACDLIFFNGSVSNGL